MVRDGGDHSDWCRAVHVSVADRLIAMLGRIGFGSAVVFTGGVAKNPCMVSLLPARLEVDVLTPLPPDIVGALGAALYALETVEAAT